MAEELARGVLGDAAYEAAYAEGGGLSLEEATALVDAHRAEAAHHGRPVRGTSVRSSCGTCDIASGAITAVMRTDQPSVTQTACATGPPIIRPRAASARLDSGL